MSHDHGGGGGGGHNHHHGGGVTILTTTTTMAPSQGHHHGMGTLGNDYAQASMVMDSMMTPGGAGGMHMMHGGGMAMYFHFGFEQYVLLQEWSASTVTSLVSTCAFFFILAILYEILKAYRRVLALRWQLFATTVHHHSSVHSRTLATKEGDGGGGGGGGTDGSLSSGGSSQNGRQKLVPDPCSSTGIERTYVMDSGGDSSAAKVAASGSSIAGPSGNADPIDPIGPIDDITVQMVHCGNVPPSYGLRHGRGGGNNVSSSSSPETVATTMIPLFATSVGELFTTAHLYSTLLYGIQVIFAYLLMLAFMLFNVWICIAILLGAATGHFMLAQKAIALQDHANEDYCH